MEELGNFQLDKIKLIQRYFRIRQIKDINSILRFDKNIVRRHNYENFTKLIQERCVLSMFNFIIMKMRRIVNYDFNVNILTSQEFLSAFVFYGYSHIIMEESSGVIISTNNLNENMINISYEFMNKYEKIIQKPTIYKIITFYKFLKRYKKVFSNWKKKDHIRLIHILTNSYYELESGITILQEQEEISETEEEYINISKQQQNNIINQVIFLNGQEYFNNYKEEEIVLDPSIQQQIKENVHRAFWELLHTELNSEPPIYDHLLSIIAELRDTFCKFIPNRPDIHDEIYENMDVDLIKNMVLNDAFDDESLYNLSVYIVSLVKRFQPPVMDSAVIEWEQNMLEKFKTKFEYSDFLVSFFRSVFIMLEEIVEYSEQAKKDLGLQN